MKYVAEEIGEKLKELQEKLDYIEKIKGNLINVIWRDYYVVIYEYNDSEKKDSK